MRIASWLFLIILATSVTDYAQTVVKYQATINNVKYVYASVPPVARLKPG